MTPRVPILVAIAALLVASVALYQSHLALEEARSTHSAGDSKNVIDVAGAPALGAASAKVALLEFSDYECPYCIRHFQQTMPRLTEAYIKTGKVRYVFRDFPIDQLHPQSIRAHEAAHCALEQNRFWELHPRLFGAPGSHTPDRLLGLAREVGLDMDAFGKCVESRRSDEAIRKTSQVAADFGASGTPTFFIGIRDPAKDTVAVLKAFSGAQPYDDFAAALDSALARAR